MLPRGQVAHGTLGIADLGEQGVCTNHHALAVKQRPSTVVPRMLDRRPDGPRRTIGLSATCNAYRPEMRC
jgi:hypothetical protein